MNNSKTQVRGMPADFAAIESPRPARATLPPSHCTHTPASSALNLADRLVTDPTTSYWLRAALVRCLARDLADAVSDVELLLSVLHGRLEELQGGAS